MTPAEKLETVFRLFDLAREMMREQLRRRFPQDPEERIEQKLRDWVMTRPGAEHGDSWGRPMPPEEWIR